MGFGPELAFRRSLQPSPGRRRKNTLSHVRRPIALAVVTALLAACGSVANPIPTPSNTAPAPTATTTAAPPAHVDTEIVYLARDRLPPAAVHVGGAADGSTSAERVLSRVRALFATASRAPLFNVASRSHARPTGVTVDGDLATVDFAVSAGDWGVDGSTAVRAFVQQLTYTITAEPGIRRSLITENGGTAIVGGEGLVIDHPVTREDVSGYVPASTDPLAWRSEPRARPLGLTTHLYSDDVAPGLARFVIDTGVWGAKASLGFTARPMRTDERAFPDLGKWTLSIALTDATTADDALRVVERSPVTAIHRMSAASGVRYDIGLEDLRPWRIAMLYEPLRLVVDIGGDPDAVSANIGLYQPVFGSTVVYGDEMSGAIRAFEGQFEYAITDATGAVRTGDATASLGTADLWGTFAVQLPELPSGRATLELRLRSPKDGAIIERAWTSFAVAP